MNFYIFFWSLKSVENLQMGGGGVWDGISPIMGKIFGRCMPIFWKVNKLHMQAF